MDQEILVDARGHRCPMPTLKLSRALRLAVPGALVRLLADDPLAKVDVPHFAAEAGVEILSQETRGATFNVLVRKPLANKKVAARRGNGAPPGSVIRPGRPALRREGREAEGSTDLCIVSPTR
ncbi:MAG TPA: sulfurtransferase TusA family protein [Caulobacteraceae bacterium]